MRKASWKFLLTLDLLNVFAFAFWGPLFTAYAISLGAKPSLAGFLYGFYTLIHAFAFLAFGRLADRWSRQLLMSLGYLIQGLSAFIFLAVKEPVFLMIPLATSALAGGMIAPAWKSQFSRDLSHGKEASIWSIYDSGEAFAIAAGTFIAGILATHFGFKTIFIPLLFLNLAAAILSLGKLPIVSKASER